MAAPMCFYKYKTVHGKEISSAIYIHLFNFIQHIDLFYMCIKENIGQLYIPFTIMCKIYQNMVQFVTEQKRITERKNKTLTELFRCLHTDSGLPEIYWYEAVTSYKTNSFLEQ